MTQSIRVVLSLAVLFTMGMLVTVQDSGDSEVITLFVGPEIEHCQGVVPQNCLQVKYGQDDDYSRFHGSIEGFDYAITVLPGEIENAPADASRWNYRLVDVLRKTRALQGNIWVLDAYLDAEGAMVDALEERPVTAEFDGDIMAGSAGCNGYSGPYTVAGDTMGIGMVVSTLMFCIPEDLMNQEAAFTALLDSVASYEIVDDQLHLNNADGEVILSFHPQEPTALVGTTWVLSSMVIGQDAVTSPLNGTEITAVFDAEGNVAGSAGCNSYSAAYTAEMGLLSIGPAVATRMACAEPDSVMDQESAYLTALEQVVYYEIHGDVLDLMGADGILLLRYTRQVES